MELEGPPSQAIRARRSVRTYSPDPIPPDLLQRLEEACASPPTAPFGETATFHVVERPFKKGEPVKLGDYGLQRNPRYFIVGTISRSPTALHSYGYLLETLILRATELGLGTCWMGYFNPEYFPELSGDGLSPAISVVGVTERPRFSERLARSAIKADKRKDWTVLFFDGSFDHVLHRETAGVWAEPLEMLRLAPSAGNTQPWRVVRGPDNAFHLHLHRVNKRYYERGLHDVDIGIAMAHFELAAREAGLFGEWKVDDPGMSSPDGTEYRVSWFPK